VQQCRMCGVSVSHKNLNLKTCEIKVMNDDMVYEWDWIYVSGGGGWC
jgi:hypothetical protein